MRTTTPIRSFPGISVIDALIWSRPVPTARAGLDVARAPGRVWLRGEHDDTETEAGFLTGARRAARAG